MRDPLVALGALAAHWRARFDVPLAIVVGSNGKTTVKEMTASILREHFGNDAVLATEGNLNNAIGLPLTLLRLSDRARAAVIELGMNHRGETRELAAIAQPTIAVVNNAQREHQEFMNSVEEVAAEHADAVLALRPEASRFSMPTTRTAPCGATPQGARARTSRRSRSARPPTCEGTPTCASAAPSSRSRRRKAHATSRWPCPARTWRAMRSLPLLPRSRPARTSLR